MKIKFTIGILIVVLLMPILGGCSLLGLGGSEGPLELNMTGELDKPFTVALEGDPSTGYQWTAEYNPAYFELMEYEYVADESKYHFTFEPRVKGQIGVTFRYQRAGEGAPLKALVYWLTVSG